MVTRRRLITISTPIRIFSSRLKLRPIIHLLKLCPRVSVSPPLLSRNTPRRSAVQQRHQCSARRRLLRRPRYQLRRLRRLRLGLRLGLHPDKPPICFRSKTRRARTSSILIMPGDWSRQTRPRLTRRQRLWQSPLLLQLPNSMFPAPRPQHSEAGSELRY